MPRYYTQFPIWKKSILFSDDPFDPYLFVDHPSTKMRFANLFSNYITEYMKLSHFWHPNEGIEIVDKVKSYISSDDEIGGLLPYIYRIVEHKSTKSEQIRPKIAEQLLLSISTVYCSTRFDASCKNIIECVESLKYLRFCYTRTEIPGYLPRGEPLFETKLPPKPKPLPIVPVKDNRPKCIVCGWFACGTCPQCGNYLCYKRNTQDYHGDVILGCAGKHACITLF